MIGIDNIPAELRAEPVLDAYRELPEHYSADPAQLNASAG